MLITFQANLLSQQVMALHAQKQSENFMKKHPQLIGFSLLLFFILNLSEPLETQPRVASKLQQSNSEENMADGVGIQKGDLKMLSGSFYIAKDRDSRPQGDDSHFICEEKQTIGLADGVGGWSSHGVDAGIYARELMNNSLLAILTQPDRQVDPMKVLNEAFMKTKAEGSTTACIITLQEGNMLHAVNVGDSGFILIRQGAVIYKSPIQQYSFNFPYQLGNSAYSNKPWEAQVIKLAVEPGDVIIAGTDGLFDNLSESQILETAATGIERGLHPEEVAWPVAEQAYQNSMDREAITPFVQAAMMAGRWHIGGKQDDITVIVSRIIDT